MALDAEKSENKEKEKIENNLILVVDDLSDEKIYNNLIYFNAGNGKLISYLREECKALIMNYVEIKLKKRDWQESKWFKEKLENGIKLLREKIKFDKFINEMLKTGIDKELIEAIYSRRIRLNFLINSYGGDLNILDFFINLLILVKMNDAEVDCYVSEKAYSAAAGLFEHKGIDNRYVLEDSEFIWHHPRAVDHINKKEVSMLYLTKKERFLFLKRTQERISEVFDFFIRRNVKDQYKDFLLEYLMSFLADEVWMGGSELFKFGILREPCFKNIQQLKEIFKKKTGITEEQLQSNELLRNYFREKNIKKED